MIRRARTPNPYTKQLMEFYTSTSPWAKFDTMIAPGWLAIGRKKDVPKHACHVGHYCGTYVWVPPGYEINLTRMTLAILDIVTADTSKLQVLKTVKKTVYKMPEAKPTWAFPPSEVAKALAGKTFDSPEAVREAVANIVRSQNPNMSREDMEKKIDTETKRLLDNATPEERTIQVPSPIFTPRLQPFPLGTLPAPSPT